MVKPSLLSHGAHEAKGATFSFRIANEGQERRRDLKWSEERDAIVRH